MLGRRSYTRLPRDAECGLQQGWPAPTRRSPRDHVPAACCRGEGHAAHAHFLLSTALP